MKKISYFVLTLVMFITLNFSVKADTISKISMDIYVDEYGVANVSETWDVKASSGSEWYKEFKNMKNQEVSNFSVYMDDTAYQLKNNWDINGSMSEKKGYYGIHKISDGFELCFGKSDYKSHVFTIKYTISNFVYDIGEEQIIDQKLVSNASIKNFEVKISSYWSFEDTLDVWGFGYRGYAYVQDGVIKASNEKAMDDEDLVLLVRFKEKKFNTGNNPFPNAKTFDEALELAKVGSSSWNDEDWFDTVMAIIAAMFNFIVFIGIFIFVGLTVKNSGSKIKNKVYPKDVMPFRDLPFKSDYDIAYLVADEYKLVRQRTDYLGSILLKWIKDDNVSVTTEEKGIFKNKNTKIEFKKEPTDVNEAELYRMMISASKDNILESNEFKNYCKNHYSKVLGWFDKVLTSSYNRLKADPKYINKVMTKGFMGREKEVVGATVELNERAKYMAGLKKFFKEFTSMKDKQAIEVKMWRDYLIYAQIFGMAKEVAKEFKNLYPEVITEETYNDIILINTFSSTGVNAASSARAAAQSYSSGGGGFSSGGGGGGSIGGGSFGGR